MRVKRDKDKKTSIGIGISNNNTARTENTTMSSPRRDRTTAPSTPAKKGCENISLFRVGFSLLSTRKIRAHFSLSLSLSLLVLCVRVDIETGLERSRRCFRAERCVWFYQRGTTKPSGAELELRSRSSGFVGYRPLR